MTDSTEKNEAGKKINWLASYPEMNPQPIVEIGFGGTIHYMNPSAQNLFPDMAKTLFKHPFLSGLENRDQLALNGKSFTERTVDIKGTYYAQTILHIKELNRIRVYALDITERIKTEYALQESEKWARTIFDAVRAGVLIIDPETHLIVDANPAAIDMIGLPKDKIVNTKCHNFVCTSEEGKCPITDLGQTVDHSEKILLDGKGQRRPIIKTVVGTMIRGRRHLIETFIDISDYKKAEDEKQKIYSQLLQAQKMESIGTLVGGIAHDFNNILQVITGYSEVLLAGFSADNPKYKELLEIRKAAERAAALTRQLLAFSRKQVFQTRTLNLNDLIYNLEKMLKRLISEDITMSLALEPNLEIIKADWEQLDQVVMNITVNARDAMPEGGKLTIKTENITIKDDYVSLNPEARMGTFVCLSITDTGVGIDKNTLPHIFEPFFTTKEFGRGTGLGLSVVYGIIKQHDGWVNVYSEPGFGTTFKIFLPVLSAVSKEIEIPISKTIQYKGDGERILVVEDEEEIRKFAGNILIKNGYTVFEAVTSAETMEIFEKENGNFDLIFSDVILPDKNGVQLVEEIRARKPDIAILLSSGYTDYKSQSSIITKKGYAFLQKPYPINELLKTIHQLLKDKPQ